MGDIHKYDDTPTEDAQLAGTGMQEEHREFLNELRESGVTNMFGAAPYLQEEFPELTKQEARDIVGEWMRSF